MLAQVRGGPGRFRAVSAAAMQSRRRIAGVEMSSSGSRALTPARSPFADEIREIHSALSELRTGAVADYIPQLGMADPDLFGIAIATVDGAVHTVGDVHQPFTIQSISKAFVYGLALEDHGRDAVLEHVGVEPTGDAFNSIMIDEASLPSLQPDGQRGRDRHHRAGRRRRRRRAPGAPARVPLALRRARPRGGRGGVRIRAQHRRPQPRDRVPDAHVRDRRRRGRGARPLLPPVLPAASTAPTSP